MQKLRSHVTNQDTEKIIMLMVLLRNLYSFAVSIYFDLLQICAWNAHESQGIVIYICVVLTLEYTWSRPLDQGKHIVLYVGMSSLKSKSVCWDSLHYLRCLKKNGFCTTSELRSAHVCELVRRDYYWCFREEKYVFRRGCSVFQLCLTIWACLVSYIHVNQVHVDLGVLYIWLPAKGSIEPGSLGTRMRSVSLEPGS